MSRKILTLAVAAAMLVCCVGCNSAPANNGFKPDANQSSGQTGNQNKPGPGEDNNGGEVGEKVVYEPIEVTNETYGSFWLRCHDYKTMPVGAFNAIIPELINDESLYASYKEAGVNMMLGGWEGISMDALNLCAQYGLGYILGRDVLVDEDDPQYAGSAEAVRESIAQAMYHEAFCGLHIKDEPVRLLFETIAKTQEFLDGIMPEMNKGMLWWNNLYPNYAKKKQLYGSKLPPELNKQYPYEQYLSEYMEICKPKVLSYDNYGFHVGLNNRGTLRTDYFPNMSACRAAALEANIPFWTFVQTCQFVPDGFAPNEAELLWSVNTGLTFGAKGIQYFTGIDAFPGQNYEGAMFDRSGNRTEVYDLVKLANTQVAAVDEVLMCCRSKGIILTGGTPWSPTAEFNSYIPESDLIKTYGELTGVEAAHALTGCFDYNGRTALYITNNSIKEKDSVTLIFNKNVSGYSVINAVKTEFTGNRLVFGLKAGEGALVVVEE